jgi:hypothetical protein
LPKSDELKEMLEQVTLPQGLPWLSELWLPPEMISQLALLQDLPSPSVPWSRKKLGRVCVETLLY